MSTSFFYKYTDHHAVDILTDLRLKVTPPNEFNDPFEFLPHVTATMTIEKAIKTLNDKGEQEGMYRRWRQQGFLGTFEGFKRIVESHMGSLASSTVDGFPANLEAYRSQYQDSVSRDHGVLCLSKNPTSLLMWSHYAASHRGTVIAFKADHRFFAESVITEVDYQDERVAFDPTWNEASLDFQAYKDAVIRRKSSHWGYEDELRMLIRLEYCQVTQTNDLKLYFYEIPSDLISKVIFGLRCPPERREQLKTVARQKKLQIQFEEARLHENKFELTFRTA